VAKRDYYDILGVSRDADGETIKKAYRKLAMQHHPDRAKEEQKAEFDAMFKECTEAYEVLSDETRRAQYNSSFRGHGGFSPNMADIFGMPHWNNGNIPRQGEHIQSVVAIELRDLVAETRRAVRIKTDDECPVCNASGLKPGTSKTTCQDCMGSGGVSNYFMQGNVRVQMKRACGRCMSSGTVIAPEDKCNNCTDGKVAVEKEVEIIIPPGMSPQYSLRVPGLGKLGANGGPRGELHVKVNIKPDERFRRSQDNPNDLLMDLPVSFVQLCLGDRLSVEMIDGSKQEVVVPAHSPAGHTITLDGQGIPSVHRKERGRLWLRLDTKVPTSLTAEQQELLQRFDEIERGKNVH
jgi:molecular chaperone DnaJ